MVFRLARSASKDDDKNNNEQGEPATATATSPSTRPASAVEEDEDHRCCCGWFGRRGGRRSSRVSPVGSSSSSWPRLAAEEGLRGAGAGGAPPDGAPLAETLTLDSIDSSSDTQFIQLTPPQKPVLARPGNSPPSQSASSATSATQNAIGDVQRGAASAHHHPLAPIDIDDRSPRNDSASSGTSANATGSTVSLQNGTASGQASGSTSGYQSAAASPGTIANVGGVPSNVDPAVDDPGEDGVDGESHPVTVVAHPKSPPEEAAPRFIEDAVQYAVAHSDASPPPKRQSAASTRKSLSRPGRSVRVPLSRPRACTPGSLGSSAGSASLMSLANGSLSSSLGNSTASLFAETLPGFDNPREAMNRGLQQLESMEWEVTMQALQTIVRLVRHHPAIMQGQLHPCCEALARQVRNLRSQVARAACQAASHLFHSLKRGMDAEAEDLSTALFNRTADTNKFLRADANSALDAMTENVTSGKAVSAIVHKGCRHQNAVVRAAGARLLARLVEKLGVERIMSQPRETRDLMLLTSARLLMEGSLETRSHTKSALKNLAQDPRLSSILVEIVPSNVMRSIDKTLKSCILRK